MSAIRLKIYEGWKKHESYRFQIIQLESVLKQKDSKIEQMKEVQKQQRKLLKQQEENSRQMIKSKKKTKKKLTMTVQKTNINPAVK